MKKPNSNANTGRKQLLAIPLLFTCIMGSATYTEGRSGNSHSALTTGTEITKDVPINDIFFNECCDEDVFIQGLAHIVVNDNILHLVVSDLTGVGLSTGYGYKGRGPSVMTNVFYSNQFEGTFTFKLNMTNADGCSYKLKVTFHIEVTSNGEVVVAFEHFETQCHS